MADVEARVQHALAELWVRMASLFGNRWVSQYGASPAGVDVIEWGAAIRGLTPRQLDAGMQSVRQSGGEWPPAAPAFRRLCMGVPSLLAVERELAGSEPVSAFSRLVWSLLGDPWRHRNADAREARRMLADAYDEAVARVLRGDALPEPSASLDAPTPRKFVPASDEVVADAIARIRGALRCSE